jgi:hypothetical protein
VRDYRQRQRHDYAPSAVVAQCIFAGNFLRPHLYCLPILKRERTARR